MMAAERGDTDSSSLDAILKSLSNRPNVQSTLILSRKDGSIIKSSGFRESQQAPVNEAKPAGDKNESSSEIPEDVQNQSSTISPAERLASSIYSFVQAADGVTSAISLNEQSVDSYGSGRASEPAQGQTDASERNGTDVDNNTDVQLLRMRTKRQEVIIFPDSNYLCCVVQNVSRGAASEGNR